jgi:hypothetical protein
MAKKLNEDQILNDLMESAYFRKSKSSASLPGDNSEKVRIINIPAKAKVNERSNEASNDRTIERSIAKKTDRENIRHTFDIYKDQLVSLHTLQITTMQSTNNKPKLGDLVKAALDMYLNSTLQKNERSIETTNERDCEQS